MRRWKNGDSLVIAERAHEMCRKNLGKTKLSEAGSLVHVAEGDKVTDELSHYKDKRMRKFGCPPDVQVRS